MKSNKFFLIVIILFLISCGQTQTNYSKLDGFIKKNYNKTLSNYDFIVAINEQGDCLNCNNKFSKALAKHIDSDNVLYLISTPGYNIDVSPYISNNQSNVLLDYNNDFSKLNLVKKCAIIDLGNEKIDTIIQIDVSNVNTVTKSFTPHPSP